MTARSYGWCSLWLDGLGGRRVRARQRATGRPAGDLRHDAGRMCHRPTLPRWLSYWRAGGSCRLTPLVCGGWAECSGSLRRPWRAATCRAVFVTPTQPVNTSAMRGATARQWAPAGERADIDDMARPARQHAGQQRLDQPERGQQVKADNAVQFRFGVSDLSLRRPDSPRR
jgi:hypothetical protein